MIYEAPEWSLASVQFTHGFPRRMIQAAHGGFLPGNVIVTSKATNLSLRRMAVQDVASLVSKISISSSGLSAGQLVNLRFAAVKYRRRKDVPDYLIRGILTYGVNFLTFQAMQAETLKALRTTDRSLGI